VAVAKPDSVSAIVPTIGRPCSLTALLESLVGQTVRVQEVIVADASAEGETARIVADPRWAAAGLHVDRIVVQPANAVRQREEAIRVSQGEFLLFLDDDVVLEPECVRSMLHLIKSEHGVVSIVADFNNQQWPQPTRLWKFYLRYVLKLRDGAWQGRVLGPLLRFGYNPSPVRPTPMEWIGAGNSLVSRDAYFNVGGFSDFFLSRSAINEDVDLGIKLSRIGKILFCPEARMAHHHDPVGRVSIPEAAADDLHNRFFILNQSMDKSVSESFGLILLFYVGEALSNLISWVRGRGDITFLQKFYGRSRALSSLTWKILRGFRAFQRY
jgi:GT2 family glycosyltransferase